MSQATHDAGRPAAAGWFGKLPALGDFAGRGLPERFTGPWDAWLQQALARTREQLGARWLGLFTTFPVWRFVLPPGLLGPDGWSGVLLPSADRVGRCFPLTAAFELGREAFERHSIEAIEASLDALAGAALAALERDDAQAFEARLALLSAPLPDADPVLALRGDPAAPLGALPLRQPLGELLARSASQWLLSALWPRTLWWSAPGPSAPGLVFMAGALDTSTFERVLYACEEHPAP